MPTTLTPHACKKLLAAEMAARGMTWDKLTARTVSFMDLARDTCVFVKIHGCDAWGTPAFGELIQVAKNNGFRVDV